MSMHCDFTEQQSMVRKGRIRPDMIVHLPMEREIVVIQGVTEAYLDAIAATTDDERKAKMEKHAQR
jgi:DNA recombination protein RmuC